MLRSSAVFFAVLLAACGDATSGSASEFGAAGSTFDEPAAPLPPPVDNREARRQLPGFVLACDALENGLVRTVQPDVPFDYISERTETRSKDGATRQIVVESGEPCATATAPTACLAQVDAVRVLGAACDRQPAELACTARYYVYTRGDAVLVAADADQLRTQIGRIDNPVEAIELVRLAGFDVSCGGKAVAPQYRATEDGYEVVTQAHECRPPQGDGFGDDVVYRVVVHVSRDGAVSELSREVLGSESPGHCMRGTMSL